MDNPGPLSQAEIDALLASLASPAAEPAPEAAPVQPAGPVAAAAPAAPQNEVARRYDFRRPERFSKEQIRALRMIHENWARRISVSFSTSLRTSVEVSLADIDQDVYTSLVEHVPDQGVYYIVSLLPLPGHVMMHMNSDLATIVVDRMLGGPGTLPKIRRPMTELGIDLLKSLSERLLGDLQEAWTMTVPVRPRIDDISLDLLLIPIALPSDAVVWITFEVRVKGTTNSMVLGLPYSVLKPIGSRLSPYTWLATPETGGGEAGELHKRDLELMVAQVKLPVSVLLGTTQLYLEEVASLQRGDLILLGPTDGAQCPVLVNGRLKFYGQPGTRFRKLAVTVEEVVAQDPPELQPARLEETK